MSLLQRSVAILEHQRRIMLMQQHLSLLTRIEENSMILTAVPWNAANSANEIYPTAPYHAHNVVRSTRMSTWDGTSIGYVLDDVDGHYVISDNNRNQISERRNLQINQQQHSFENLEKIRIEEGAQGSEAITCSICLIELPVGTEAIRLPNPCGHVYHQDCIMKWLKRSGTCPLCRRHV